MNNEKEFEELWNKHIRNYGKNFGRFYNGLNRRKEIARLFYVSGMLDVYKEINEELMKIPRRVKS